MSRIASFVITLAIAIATFSPAAVMRAVPPEPWRAKVDPWVLDAAADGAGETAFLVFLADQADVSPAAALGSKREKGEYVYRTLSEHAARTQAPLRRALDRMGVAWQPFWVANMIWVRGDASVMAALAARADVAHLYANPHVRLDAATAEAPDAGVLRLRSARTSGRNAAQDASFRDANLRDASFRDASFRDANLQDASFRDTGFQDARFRDAGDLPADRILSLEAIEWGVSKIGAPAVWGAGINGAGAVVGGQDTGYRWTHEALKARYRGWDGTTADHDYNWHDAIHEGASDCGVDSLVPCDDSGHGTHTMGTMVGDDGGTNQVGVAPGATWIGCRNMLEGDGTPATYAECYEWFIAPARVDGSDPDPGRAPDVINNSWGCPASEGCTDPTVLLAVVENVRAAGIVTVHSAGNAGAACSSINTPAAIYDASFTVGATNSTDAIAYFSSRGPVTVDGSGRMKPDVSAPGDGVRSSYASNDTSYANMSGTSMAGPHVAGLVALLIDANPRLRGEVDVIEDLIGQSALHLTTTLVCGGDTASSVPNNVFGWGRVDAWAAYEAAIAPCAAPATVGDLAIAPLATQGVQLAWTPADGASAYHLWWDDAPYFEPGADCFAAANCRAVTVPTADAPWPTVAGLTAWVVQAAKWCAVAPASNRVAAFRYDLVAGG